MADSPQDVSTDQSSAIPEPSPGVPIYDISGKEPVLGSVPHEDLQEAVNSGKYSLPQGKTIPVFDPDGNFGSIPSEDSAQAFQTGYKYATPEDVQAQKYAGTGQALAAAAEGAASAATFGLSNAAEQQALGIPGEDIEGRAAAHPIARGAGELAGLAGSALIPGVGEANLLHGAEEAGAAALGLAEPATRLAKIGSSAVKGFIGNALFQSGDELGKLVNDPSRSMETAVADIGLSGLIGGGIGGTFSATVAPLWNATVGNKVGGVLKAVVDKLGGIEGHTGDEVDSALSKLGLSPEPEIKAALSSDPAVRQLASVLNQTDSNASGRAFQEARQGFLDRVHESMVTSLGKDPAAVTDEFSEADHGRKILSSLSDEYKAKMDPISEAYEGNKQKYGSAELAPSIADKSSDAGMNVAKQVIKLNQAMRASEKALKSGSVEDAIEHSAKIADIQNNIRRLNETASIPGTTDMISDQIGKMVQDQGWSGTDDIMREVNRLTKRLPELSTISDLQKEMTTVGNNTASTLPFGQQTPLSRAGGMIKGILRNAESDAVGRSIGSEEGADALAAFTKARQEFSKVATLKEALDDRLKIRGSATNYGKGLAEMAKTDGEAGFRRLSGKGDANILEVLNNHFPKTAEAVRQAHVDQIVAKSARAAKNGALINPTALTKAIEGMSPEARNFILDQPTKDKLDAVSTLLERINDPAHNFSNTARTVEKLQKYIPGSVLGLASLLTGHGGATSAVVGLLADKLGKDAPDAARLSLLKFLGSNKTINPSAFKSSFDMIRSTINGQNMLARASKNIFRSGVEVLPQSVLPTQKDRDKLDASLKNYQQNPMSLEESGQGIGHYMPEHNVAATQMTSTAVNYLNSIRPQTAKANPLDSKPVLSSAAKAAYARQLDIAQQPLMIAKHLNEGTLTSADIRTASTIYPNLYAQLNQKIMDSVNDKVQKGEIVPYKQRLGLSLMSGQPLDSSMTPASIVAAQPAPQTPQQPQGQPKGISKPKAEGLSELSSMYQTPGQAAQANRIKG